MPNYGWRKQWKCFIDSKRCFEFRRIRDIWVRDIEGWLYMWIKLPIHSIQRVLKGCKDRMLLNSGQQHYKKLLQELFFVFMLFCIQQPPALKPMKLLMLIFRLVYRDSNVHDVMMKCLSSTFTLMLFMLLFTKSYVWLL